MADVIPAQIERFGIQSSTIKSAGYERGVFVLEFHNGSVFAYKDFDIATFEAFAQAESKGKFFNQEIRGKYQGEKITGKCASCGAEPHIIGGLCPVCGTGLVREVDRVHREAYEGEDRVKAELSAIKAQTDEPIKRKSGSRRDGGR